jgi:hypothetical protein
VRCDITCEGRENLDCGGAGEATYIAGELICTRDSTLSLQNINSLAGPGYANSRLERQTAGKDENSG